MARLLRADLARLWRSLTFWVCTAAAAVWGGVKVYFDHEKWLSIPINDPSAENI